MFKVKPNITLTVKFSTKPNSEIRNKNKGSTTILFLLEREVFHFNDMF